MDPYAQRNVKLSIPSDDNEVEQALQDIHHRLNILANRLNDLTETFFSIVEMKNSEILRVSLENAQATNTFFIGGLSEDVMDEMIDPSNYSRPTQQYEDQLHKELTLSLKALAKAYARNQEEVKREAAINVALKLVGDWKLVAEMFGKGGLSNRTKGRRLIQTRRDESNISSSSSSAIQRGEIFCFPSSSG